MPSSAEPQRDRRQQFAVLALVHDEQLAVSRDQRRSGDLRGDAAETGTCAVRAGGDGARDRLTVDVAEIGHREAIPGQQSGNAVQTRAGSQRRASGLTVGGDEPREVRQIQQHPRSDGDTREAVARTHRLDVHPAQGGGLDGALDRRGGRRELHTLGAHLRRASPVLPLCTRPGHRNAFPSPRYVGDSPTSRPPSTT